MANDWHPLMALQPIEFIFPEPGTLRAFAVIRLVPIGPDLCWRAVTYDEPRELIGYSADLRSIARAVYRRWMTTAADKFGPVNAAYPDRRKQEG